MPGSATLDSEQVAAVLLRNLEQCPHVWKSVLRFLLALKNGASAKPSLFVTRSREPEPGDVVITGLSSRQFRVVAVDTENESSTRDDFDGLLVVEPLADGDG